MTFRLKNPDPHGGTVCDVFFCLFFFLLLFFFFFWGGGV